MRKEVDRNRAGMVVALIPSSEQNTQVGGNAIKWEGTQ
jgi:hypothetical protein